MQLHSDFAPGTVMQRTGVVLAAAVAALLFLEIQAAKLPASFKRCKQTDSKFHDCLKGAIRTAIQETSKGVPSLGVLPVDPLRVSAISIGQGKGPVAVSLDFKDIDIIGLRELQVQSVMFDTKNYKLEGKITVPVPIKLRGNYKVDGKVLILPIKGEGKCDLTLDELSADVKIHGEKLVKDGETYMKINNFEFSFNTKRLRMDFQNLFNGDKALGNTMNTFLNENWQEILKELKPAIETTFGATFREVSNRIFLKVPFNQLFEN